jgi:hypothetical protein
MTVTRAHKVNPNITFEVFIHKVDGLLDDHKIGTQDDGSTDGKKKSPYSLKTTAQKLNGIFTNASRMNWLTRGSIPFI